MAKNERSFFAYKTDHGYVFSLAQKNGRKNYILEKADPHPHPHPQTAKDSKQSLTELAPLAIESFALKPEYYHSLMERVEHLHQKRTD